MVDSLTRDLRFHMRMIDQRKQCLAYEEVHGNPHPSLDQNDPYGLKKKLAKKQQKQGEEKKDMELSKEE